MQFNLNNHTVDAQLDIPVDTDNAKVLGEATAYMTIDGVPGYVAQFQVHDALNSNTGPLYLVEYTADCCAGTDVTSDNAKTYRALLGNAWDTGLTLENTDPASDAYVEEFTTAMVPLVDLLAPVVTAVNAAVNQARQRMESTVMSRAAHPNSERNNASFPIASAGIKRLRAADVKAEQYTC